MHYRCTVASPHHLLISTLLQFSYLQPNVSQVTYHHSTSYAYPPVPTIATTEYTTTTTTTVEQQICATAVDLGGLIIK